MLTLPALTRLDAAVVFPDFFEELGDPQGMSVLLLRVKGTSMD